jgi:hypothetical protein
MIGAGRAERGGGVPEHDEIGFAVERQFAAPGRLGPAEDRCHSRQ